MIYTSGSTGTPKGAANTHAGRVNDLLSMQDILQLTEEDRILHKTSLSFDVSVWEIFHALSIGCQLVIAQPGRVNDSQYYRDIVNKHAVTVTQFVPSMLGMIVDDLEPGDWASIRHLIVGGEALNRSVQTQLQNALPHVHLWNMYGPTEASDDVTYWRCLPDDTGSSPPIGSPIWNTQLYILDPTLTPVPDGIAGELYIGGALSLIHI